MGKNPPNSRIEMGKSIQGVAGNAEQLQNQPMKHPR